MHDQRFDGAGRPRRQRKGLILAVAAPDTSFDAIARGQLAQRRRLLALTAAGHDVVWIRTVSFGLLIGGNFIWLPERVSGREAARRQDPRIRKRSGNPTLAYQIG